VRFEGAEGGGGGGGGVRGEDAVRRVEGVVCW